MTLDYVTHPRRVFRAIALYLKIFGLPGLAHAAYVAISKRKRLVRVARRWSEHPIYLRLNSSDLNVFKQVFMEREYQIIQQSTGKLEVVIDAGANVGLTSIFIAALHPDARIYAVEPEDENFRVLKLNTATHPRIRCIKGALWGRDEDVAILSSQASDWAFRVDHGTHESVNCDIRGYRVSSLIDYVGETRISLLKMDIEGAEWEVLGDSAAWIDKVDNIVLELHENIRPGCTDLFRKTTSGFIERATSPELTLVSRPLKA